jgi:hypothetical protein
VGQVVNLRGLSTRLGGIGMLVGRPIDNRPQVANLPHIKPRARLDRCLCPIAEKLSRIATPGDARPNVY